MTQPSPADELRAAAFQLRNPFHHPGLTVGIDTDVAHPLADWLDHQADMSDRLAQLLDDPPLTPDDHPALAVARAIAGSQA